LGYTRGRLPSRGRRVRAAAVAVAAAVGLLATGVARAQVLSYPATGPITAPSEQTVSATAFCPGDSVVVGGGYLLPVSSEGLLAAQTSMPLGDEGWQVTERNVDDLHDYTFRVGAGCAQPEPLIDVRYDSQEIKLDARFDPGGHDSGTATASCPPGYDAIGGGYDTTQGLTPLKVGIAATFPQGGAGTAGAPGWSVSAKNYDSFQSNYVSSTAICIPSPVARGIIGLDLRPETDKVEQGSLASECVGANALGGGVASPSTVADFDTLNFTDPSGYFVDYNSHRPGSDTITVVAACADVTTLLGPLTQTNFDRYCADEYEGRPGIHAVAGAGALDWRCVWNTGSDSVGPLYGDVCENAYFRFRDVFPKTTFLEVNDPLSWRCWAPNPSVLRAGAANGKATRVQSPGRRSKARVSGRVKLDEPLRLGKAKVTIRHLLHESTKRGELFRDGRGGQAVPVGLGAAGRRGAATGDAALTAARGKRVAVFRTRSRPRFRLRLAQNGDLLRFRLLAKRGRVRQPLMCSAGSGRATHLTTRFIVDDGAGAPAQVEANRPWRCQARDLVTARPAQVRR
jgi:hypothetical protein